MQYLTKPFRIFYRPRTRPIIPAIVFLINSPQPFRLTLIHRRDHGIPEVVSAVTLPPYQFHFHYLLPVSSSLAAFVSRAFTAASPPSTFFFLSHSVPARYFCPVVLLFSLRNDEKSTQPLIGSVNPVQRTHTLMDRARPK